MASRETLNGRVFRTAPSFGGLIGAPFGFIMALTPSLLPRPTIFMILVGSIGIAFGYGVGSAIEWLIRSRFKPSLARFPSPKVAVFVLVLCYLPGLAFAPAAISLQLEQQQLLSFERAYPDTLALIAGSFALGTLLICAGRGMRVFARFIARLVSKIGFVSSWLAPRPSRVHWLRFAASFIWVGFFVGLFSAFLTFATNTYDELNMDGSGSAAPSSLGLNSGSEQSLSTWESLGRQGRFYVANTMRSDVIAEITGRPAQTPTRVYVGMESFPDPAARVDLALAELDRVDAWSREYLVIFGVTGTGWVDQDAINSLETITGGDVTTVAVQYSAVPSWIGFLIDPDTTQVQNSLLVDALLDRYNDLDPDSRPKLVMFGESLGSMGTQGAWEPGTSPTEVTSVIGNIIWIGPPAESNLWKSWSENRTGGPAWLPRVEDGSIVRVLPDPTAALGQLNPSSPTVVIAAHANDPVVYWSPSLMFSRPDWADDPLGPGVSPEFRWYPVLSFFQVGLDLVAGGEPPEVGHNYSAGMAPAIALGVDDPDFNDEDLERLQAALPGLKYNTD